MKSAKFLSQVREIPKAVHAEVRNAVVAGASLVTDSAKSLAPVNTGALRDSIQFTMGDQDTPRYSAFKSSAKGQPELAAIVTAGNSKVRYAHLVEFGTSPHELRGLYAGAQHPGSAAQPFFYPAYRANKAKVKRLVSSAVTKGAKKVAGK